VGVLRLFSPDAVDTCGGSAQIGAQPGMPRTLRVSDCIDSDTGTYALSLNIVGESDESCGAVLGCGEAVDRVLAAGEVDSFVFRAVAGNAMELSVSDPNDESRKLRLRLYAADATLLRDSCGGTLEISAQASGMHTLLLSACDGAAAGPYRVRWQRSPSCGAALPPDEFAYIFNAGSGTLAGMSTSMLRSETLVPVFASAADAGNIAASVDGAFVYVGSSASPSIKVVNTTANRAVASATAAQCRRTALAHCAKWRRSTG
jgi:hypothetical protein